MYLSCDPDVGVAEVIGADASGQPFVVDQRRERFAEAVCGHACRSELVPDLPPLLVEIVRVAQSPGR